MTAAGMTCVSLLVSTCRSQRLCLPASATALRMYFPSGEMAAWTDSPLSVTFVMVKFWKGTAAALPRISENTL